MRTFIFFFIFLFTLVSPATSRFSSVIHHHTATTVFDPALSCVCIPDSSENDAAKVFSCISITFSVVYHGHDATTILASSAACYGSTDSTVYHASKVFIGSFPFFPDHLSDGLPQFMELVSSRVHFEMVYGFSFISSFISSFPFHSDLLSDQRNHTIPADQMRRTMPLMLRDGGNLEVIDFAKMMAAPRYHHLTRTDQWPPAACINSFRRCKHPIPKYFTLHGLWPSNRALPHPEWCTPPLFDPNEIVGLVSKLSVEWPNLFGADEILWRHQWEKHGSCTPFKEYDYFKLGIELMEEFNLTAILENNAIIPRVAPYRTQDISDAIEYSNLGVKPSLICVGVFLTEIKLCLDPLAQKYKVCPYLSKNCPNKLHLST